LPRLQSQSEATPQLSLFQVPVARESACVPSRRDCLRLIATAAATLHHFPGQQNKALCAVETQFTTRDFDYINCKACQELIEKIPGSTSIWNNGRPKTQQHSGSLLNVRETAERLHVSPSWVRRHMRELPVVRMGHLIRFDPKLLSERIQGRTNGENSLRPERGVMLSRFQRGYPPWL
jgi:hypothetical protein